LKRKLNSVTRMFSYRWRWIWEEVPHSQTAGQSGEPK